MKWGVGQHVPNPIWCEHFKNKNIWSNPPFGAVRFRSRGAFCNWSWLGRFGHWLTAFTRPFNLSTTIPFTLPSQLSCEGFTGLSFLSNNKQNQKSINLWRPSCGLHEGTSPTEVCSPLLKYPRSISIWRRNSFYKFPFLIDNFFKILCCFFIVLRRMNLFNPIWER